MWGSTVLRGSVLFPPVLPRLTRADSPVGGREQDALENTCYELAMEEVQKQ
jgi:hypothetical protein